MSNKSIQSLREQRGVLAKQAKELLNSVPTDKWIAAEHGAQFDALEAQISNLDDQIDRFGRLLKDEQENQETEGARNALDRALHDKRKAGKPTDALVIFDSWLRGGDTALSAEQQAVIRNTMSTTTGSEGGFTVPSLIATQLIDSMKAYGAMRYLAETIKTSDGKPFSYPTSDGTAELGEIVAQNATATSADPVFGSVSLNVFKFSSKIVAVPIELIQDSNIDIEAMVRRRLAQRLGRIMNQKFTIGVGTTEPDGVIARATVGKVGTTGQTTSIIIDDLMDLIESVDPAYRTTACAWMTNSTLLRVIRKIKDTTGRPIWSPDYDQGLTVGANPDGHGGYADQNTPMRFDTLLNYPIVVNNDIATPAANAKTMSFGDHSYYKIRDSMEMNLFRFTDSVYATKGQVGFLAFARSGGNLVDLGAIRTYQHSAT